MEGLKIGAIAGIVILLSMPVYADKDGNGRDTFRYSSGLSVSFLSKQDFWDDKGIGGWRTKDDQGNLVVKDKGYVVYDLTSLEDDGFYLCRIICEGNSQCKGIEYIAIANNDKMGVSMTESGLEYRVNKCEIHYDDFYACDANAPVATAFGANRAYNGCWVRL